jgi:uncharacterized protein
MPSSMRGVLKALFTVRWKPSTDLAAVGLTWLLVVGALYTATFIIGQDVWGGMGYFITYAVLTAAICGIGIPVYWMCVVRRRSLADLGITTRYLGISLALQLVFALLQNLGTLAVVQVPSLDVLLPLLALALCIGFFEAIFWRGWVQLRLEESFGILPGLLLGSALYAAYHIGYGMSLDEMAFLFVIGLMYGTCFRLTRSIFVLWPVFQPSGQLVTLVRDGLKLPVLASLGFVETFVLMVVLIWAVPWIEHKRELLHSRRPV